MSAAFTVSLRAGRDELAEICEVAAHGALGGGDLRSRIARWISRCCCRIASPSIEAPIVSISDGCRTSSIQLVKARSSSFRAVVAITRWKRVSAARNASEAGWFPSASAIASSRSRGRRVGRVLRPRGPASGTSR